MNLISKSKTKYKINEVEITRFYVISKKLNEEEIIELYFICKPAILDSTLLFDWSNINSTISYINNEFTKYFRNTGFCTGIFLNIFVKNLIFINYFDLYIFFILDCKISNNINNLKYNYTGLSTGSSIFYQCRENMILKGYATSVCMMYASWSHDTPTCE